MDICSDCKYGRHNHSDPCRANTGRARSLTAEERRAFGSLASSISVSVLCECTQVGRTDADTQQEMSFTMRGAAYHAGPGHKEVHPGTIAACTACQRNTISTEGWFLHAIPGGGVHHGKRTTCIICHPEFAAMRENVTSRGHVGTFKDCPACHPEGEEFTCAVRTCPNTRGGGVFIGTLCKPCADTLAGKGGSRAALGRILESVAGGI